MNRMLRVAFRAAGLAMILCSGFGSPQVCAQRPLTGPRPASPSEQPGDSDDNPFAPEPAPTLPPGMTGSDATDPRATLTSGLYDAGEAAMGIKHVMLFKKPDAFQLGTAEPDDPKVKQFPYVEEMIKARDSGLPVPRSLVYNEMADALHRAVQQIMLNNADIQKSLNEAAAEIDRATAAYKKS